jgi:hypothetical protein
MNDRLRTLTGAVISMLVVCVAATATLTSAAESDDPCRDRTLRGHLKERVAQFYRAASEERWDDLYAMVAPSTKDDYASRDAFVEEFRRLSPNVGTRIHVGDVECFMRIANDPPEVSMTAEVSFAIKVDKPDGRHESYRGWSAHLALIGTGWLWVSESSGGCDRPNFGSQPTVGAPSKRASCSIRGLRAAGG